MNVPCDCDGSLRRIGKAILDVGSRVTPVGTDFETFVEGVVPLGYVCALSVGSLCIMHSRVATMHSRVAKAVRKLADPALRQGVQASIFIG